MKEGKRGQGEASLVLGTYCPTASSKGWHQPLDGCAGADQEAQEGQGRGGQLGGGAGSGAPG